VCNSARKRWTQRSQFTGAAKPLSWKRTKLTM
jgi:hypothetical protein